MKEIRVPIDFLTFGVAEKNSSWWNFDRMLESWRMLDSDPGAAPNTLPLWELMKDVSSKIYDTDHTDEELTDAVNKWRNIYLDIRNSGWNPLVKGFKPIQCRIRPNGKLYIGNGHHRVSMLKHLGYEYVDVVVLSRARGFQEFKRKLKSLYRREFLYQPVDHPDVDWEVNGNGYLVVYDTIIKCFHPTDLRILDIGCCTGWYCYKLAELGNKTIGIDINGTRIELAKYQREYRNASPRYPQFYKQSFEKHLDGTVYYDLILLLNVIHHYIRRNPDEAVQAMKQVANNSDNCLVQLGIKRIPISLQDFVHRVKMETDFKEGVVILSSEARPIVVFSKKKSRC